MDTHTQSQTNQQQQNQPSNSSSTQNTTEVCRVSFKAPEFWRAEPELWFIRIESQFRTASITSDDTKFDYTIASLNCETLCEVGDIIRNPPANNKYHTLKQRLISRFAEGETRKIQKLLAGIHLGDDKPSHLLRKMQSLSSDKVSNTVLKTLWFEQLPQNMKAILMVSGDDLNNLAEIADKIHDTLDKPTAAFYELNRNSENTLQKQIDKLTVEVTKLTNQNNTLQKKEKDFEKCWYHHTFGSKAKKCVPPCNFNQGNDQRKQ